MDKRKTTPSFWIAVAATALLAIYALSFGPVCWKFNGGNGWILRAYAPFARLASDGPVFVAVPLLWYARVGVGPDERLNLPTRMDGTQRTSWPSRNDPVQAY